MSSTEGPIPVSHSDFSPAMFSGERDIAASPILDRSSNELSGADLRELKASFASLSAEEGIHLLQERMPDHPLVRALTLPDSKEEALEILKDMVDLPNDPHDKNSLSFITDDQKKVLAAGFKGVMEHLDTEVTREIDEQGGAIKSSIGRYERLLNTKETMGSLTTDEQVDFLALKNKLDHYMVPSNILIKAPEVEKKLSSFFSGVVDIERDIQKPIQDLADKVVDAYPPSSKKDFVKMASSHSFDDAWRERMEPKLFKKIKIAGGRAIESIARAWVSDRSTCESMIEKAKQKLDACTDTHKKKALRGVIARAESNIAKIDAGEYVRLPRYYHGCGASKSSLSSILNSSIESRPASYGPGAYLSTRAEYDYGPIYLALSEHDVHYLPLSQKGENDGQENLANTRQTADDSGGKAAWRATERNIPIRVAGEEERRVAYVFVDEGRLREGDSIETIKASLKRDEIDVEVIDFQEALFEQEILEDIKGVSEPHEWSKGWEDREAKSAISHQFINSFLRNAPVSDDDDDSDWSDDEDGW